jgi:hypothetical protein
LLSLAGAAAATAAPASPPPVTVLTSAFGSGSGDVFITPTGDTWTTYKVNRRAGDIVWQLGGKASSFTVQAGPGQTLDSAGELFAWQHDPEALGHGLYTCSTTSPPATRYSRTAGRSRSSSTHATGSRRWSPPMINPRAWWRRRKATPSRPVMAACSSDGDRCRTSPSSTATAT